MKRYKILLVSLLSIFIGLCFYSVYQSFINSRIENNTKILLIGIDGATWKVINPMIKEGKLPNIAKLIKNGVYGKLNITGAGIISPEIWTSIATSKSPKKHKIRSFLVKEKGINGLIPVRSYHRKEKAIWNILSELDIQSGVVNWLVTYPPESIKGVMVSGRFDATYPEDLWITLVKLNIDNYLKYIPDDKKLRGDYEELIRATTVSKYLMQNKKLDFFTVYIKSSDDIQHFFWKYMEPEYFEHPVWNLTSENIPKYKNAITEYYQAIDKLLIGELINFLGRETIVIIASDHGFKAEKTLETSLNINRILEKIGLLTFQENSKQIDFSKTKAYDITTDLMYFVHEIYINISNEKSVEYKEVKDRIKQVFSNFSFVDTGENLFTDIIENRNIIKMELKKEFHFTRLYGRYVFLDGKKFLIDEFWDFKDLSGTHDKHDAIIIMSGEMIKKGERISNAHCFDIIPTILYLLGLPVAEDMEGKVLSNFIRPEYLKKHPIEYIESYGERGQIEILKQKKITDKDKELLEKLRSLGYIQ